MGRSALVTGGNRGIGLAVVRALVEAGDSVTATYRSGEPPADAPEGVTWVRADVTDTAAVDAAFEAAQEAHGPVEVAVANAGITKDQLVMRMPDEDFTSVLDTNLTGSFRVARRAAAGMLRLKRGRIVLVSSVVALSGSAGQVNYAASKSGLVGLARSLAREVGSRGITVNVVAPGFVETDMTAQLSDARRTEILGSVPLKRLASPEEVAAVVRFLAGEDAAYVTGAVVPVDGGLGMGH
ncbi:3-oxoacyl-[acyl-carrier protein] reductase [Motilibacter peucedani]|uniref:3-oxoacyl-[acyl-carrier protein] reductase n=1 Tax=Motilibacter peucedani TaxID=598650 RepID=A0A420XK85_9ACTN|nr:3-oxoacyl-ACP reductase FabG [Motilibacter peucedani]RKS68043.1 3-oxoacyl-[acyl-carrier protein] reductase [Motilibacter peucedani]